MPPDPLLADMFDFARALNRKSQRVSILDARPAGGGNRPGDEFNRRGPSWSDILIPAGWKLVHHKGDVAYWRRPGKDERGISATTGHCRSETAGDLLYVFSTNARPFEPETSYSRFAAYILLVHGGDFQKGAKALAEQGYGEQTETFKMKGGRPGAATFTVPTAGLDEPEYWTHDTLMGAKFQPQPWLIEGLIADESLNILGGVQKAGKSWLALQMAQAVGSGDEFLGRTTQFGEVIYLALEDGARRLQDRLRKQRAPLGLPIIWYTRFPKLDDGNGMALLTELVARRPRLLVVDTLAAVKSGRVDEQSSGPMADLFNALRMMAQHYAVAILVVHHHGKTVSGDPAHDLRGSSAIGAAADILLGLYRVRRNQQGDVSDEGMPDPVDEVPPEFWLKARGRDIEDLTMPITFGVNTDWRWRPAERGTHDRRAHAKQDADAKLLEVVRGLGTATAEQIEQATGLKKTAVYDRLRRLVNERVLMYVSIPQNGAGRPLSGYRIRAEGE